LGVTQEQFDKKNADYQLQQQEQQQELVENNGKGTSL
jgi:hypothetical protein